MHQQEALISIHKKWITLFGLWLLLLSGLLVNFIGSPGILQAIRLRNLLQSKTEQLHSMRQELEKTKSESHELETSRSAQIREIRRVLSYAAPDELVFDFSSPDQF